MSASKRKGTAAETAVVGYLRERGWPHAERRALAGARDRGDVAGIAGCVLEVKSCARMEPAAWLDEAAAERANDGAAVGAVIAKRRGTSDPARWYALLTVEQLADLLISAGYQRNAT